VIGIRDVRGQTGQDLKLDEMEVALSLPADGRAPAARFNSGPALFRFLGAFYQEKVQLDSKLGKNHGILPSRMKFKGNSDTF